MQLKCMVLRDELSSTVVIMNELTFEHM